MEVKKGVPVPKTKISGQIRQAILGLLVRESLHVKKEECGINIFNAAVFQARKKVKGTGVEYITKTDDKSYNIWRVK